MQKINLKKAGFYLLFYKIKRITKKLLLKKEKKS